MRLVVNLRHLEAHGQLARVGVEVDPDQEISIIQQRVLAANSMAVFTPPGYLLFVRERTLMAQPFDAAKLQTTGDAESQAKTGHDVYTFYNWDCYNIHDALIPMDDVVGRLEGQYGKANAAATKRARLRPNAVSSKPKPLHCNEPTGAKDRLTQLTLNAII
jgi:hypothetical protein